MNLHVVLYPALVGFSVLPDSGIRLVDTPFVSLGVSGDGFSVRSQSPSLHFYYSTTHIVNTMGIAFHCTFPPLPPLPTYSTWNVWSGYENRPFLSLSGEAFTLVLFYSKATSGEYSSPPYRLDLLWLPAVLSAICFPFPNVRSAPFVADFRSIVFGL